MKFGRLGSIFTSQNNATTSSGSSSQVRRSFLSGSLFRTNASKEKKRIAALRDVYQPTDNLRPFFQSVTDPNLSVDEPPKQVKGLLQTSLSTSTNIIDIVEFNKTPRVSSIRQTVEYIMNKFTPEQYAQHCDNYLDVKTVTKEDVRGYEGLSEIIDQDGVFAKKNIPAGTVFIYAGQYPSIEQLDAVKQEIGNDNLQSYGWTPKSGVVVSGFNAGNITKKVNCFTDETGWPDSRGNNMAMYAFDTENPLYPVVCYVAHRDIKAEEQLFINYGELYRFR